ncbi:hypothetical protein [Myroides sp. DW712]|uniref:hypothetical protein n=1 Tax=Myroides sp. DW712 TaxID=3389800 RepID=UPI00397DAE3D
MYLFSVLLVGFVSCNQEEEEWKKSPKSVVGQRLEFSSVEELEAFYHRIEEEGNGKEVKDIGITSLYSIKRKNSIEKEFSEDFHPSLNFNGITTATSEFDDTSGDPEEEDDFITDDSFARLLNDQGEVLVGTKVYKYTDVGLFSAGKNQYEELVSFLAAEGIKSFPEKTDPLIVARYVKKYQPNVYSSVTTNVQYFHARIANDDGMQSEQQAVESDRDGPGSNTNAGNTNQVEDPMTTYMEGLNHLVTRKVHKNVVGNIFGNDNYVVYYEYRYKKRLKVKYYRQNYGLVYAVGCKVKNQKKGWTGIWRTQNTSILSMGVKSMVYEFPSMNGVFSANHRPIVLHVEKEVYTVENNTLIRQNSSQYPALPTFFYNSVNAVAEAVLEEEISPEQIDEIFYKNIWNLLKDVLSISQKKVQQKIAFVVGMPKKVMVQYYDFSTISYGKAKISRVFDWGIMSPPISYNFSTGFNVNSGAVLKAVFNFKQLPPLKLDIYSMVYDENQWKGVSLKIDN